MLLIRLCGIVAVGSLSVPPYIINLISPSFPNLITQKNFDSQEFQVKEILSEVFQHATNMDNEYEIAGKSIEDT